jgi:hypothetical protein
MLRLLLTLTLAVSCSFVLLSPASARPQPLFVSAGGSDTASGSSSHPLATLDGARAMIRAWKTAGRLPKGGVAVQIRAGTYSMREPFQLTAADDASLVPITYAAAGKGAVIIEGGQSVTHWMPVTDPAVLSRLDPAARGHVLVTNLKAQNITDYGTMSQRGFGHTIRPAGLELFYNDAPMTLAQWPAPGQWAKIAGADKDQGKDFFSYSGDEPARWQPDDDVWVHGYWGFDWADDYEKVASIDQVHHTIHIPGQPSAFGYGPGHRWYALNILEELNQPGEWYLDRPHGLLYFWPPTDIAKGHAVVSLAENLVSMDGVSNVTLRGLTFQDCRGTAITIENGVDDQITDCTIREVGNVGLTIYGATGSGAEACEITETGDGGVILDGGDRKTLTPGNDFVTDCVIHDYSRWSRTYCPAVKVSGVGNAIAHNLMYDAPHSAILLSGNDNIVEYNEVHDVCRETGDSGAFYMGRDWTMRGNIVRYNEFHDLGGGKGLLGDTDVNAIYLDDTAAGTSVYGNECIRAGRGVLVGGGRDDIVTNNVFIDCRQGISLDARGLGWAKNMLAPGGDWHMQDKLAAVPYDQPPYSTRYPHLAGLLGDDPGAPKYDVIADNIAVNCKTFLDIQKEAQPGVSVHDNLAEPGPKLTKLPAGFVPIPLSQIGPRKTKR